MSEEDAHVAVLREAYRQWHATKGGSVRHWLDLMTDDVSFRSLSGGSRQGESAMGFNHENGSPAAVEAYFAAMANEWEMVRFEPVDFIAQGDRVAVLGDCAWKSKRTGRIAESPFAQFFTFRDGRITAIVEMFDTATAVAVHGAPAA
jgi:ketosteroid isomerase-like protein